MERDEWRIDVTDADVRAAKREWVAARDGDATDAEVERRYGVLRMLVHAQAQQLADDVRADAGRARTPDAD